MKTIHRSADHVRPSPGGVRHADRGRVPTAWLQRGELLHLKEALRKLGDDGNQRAAAAARRERALEALGRRSDARQAHLVGGRPKKVLKPTRRRSLANWMRERFQIAVIRSCRLAGVSRAAWYERSVQSALRLRIRDIAHRRPRFGYQPST